jgi:hypothetical protein
VELSTTFQLVGSLCGMAGGTLVALARPWHRAIGFSIWLFSNLLLISWALMVGAWYMVALFLFYSVTSSLGLRTSLRCMRVERVARRRQRHQDRSTDV